MFGKIKETLDWIITYVEEKAYDPIIELSYPNDCKKAGMDAGHLILRKEAGGGFRYDHQMISDGNFAHIPSERVVRHKFESVESLAKYLANSRVITDPLVFFYKDGQFTYDIEVLDERRPSKGALTCFVDTHPFFDTWFDRLSNGADLSHNVFADFLLDNAQTLEDPTLADYMSSFRAAKTIEYDADLGSKGYEGVRVVWKGSTNQKGKTDFQVPREFGVNIPINVGPWNPGEEPKYLLNISVRVIPPKEGAEPLFRLKWTNKSEIQLLSQLELKCCLENTFIHPVYHGDPKAFHFIVPEQYRETKNE